MTLAGDTDAFGEIVRRYKQMVFGVAYGVLKDYHASEDCAQETFIDAYTALSTLRNPDGVSSWLWGIARRKALLALSRTKPLQNVMNLRIRFRRRLPRPRKYSARQRCAVRLRTHSLI
jgi:DNA-directed RNA polymerase specialized sigma subunit, sigma24 homolog